MTQMSPATEIHYTVIDRDTCEPYLTTSSLKRSRTERAMSLCVATAVSDGTLIRLGIGRIEPDGSIVDVTRTIKLEYHDGSTRRTRWLDAMPESIPDARLTIAEPGRAVTEVVISTEDERIPFDSHAVIFSDGVSDYWIDAGSDFGKALALAESVLVRGAAAYEAVQ
jgi:hypothetical protein